MHLSVGEAAHHLCVSVVTMRRWDREDKIRPTYRTHGGDRRSSLSSLGIESQPKKTICYARVSSYDQKDDLVRQATRLKSHCNQNKWSDVVTDRFLVL